MIKNTPLDQLEATILKIVGAYAPSTIRAYKVNFKWFIKYCESIEKNPLPANPMDVASYIIYLTNRNLKSASIRIAIASIASIHKLNQLDDPTLHPDVKIEMRRMHRNLGRLSKQAFGITKPILEKMIGTTKEDLRGLRDAALLMLAYDSLCRRSELTSLRLDDIEWDDDGRPTRIRLRKSKTDQEAIGKSLRLAIKTQEATKKWIEHAEIMEGFLFRGVKNNGDISQRINPGQINRIYKRLAAAANLSKEQINKISGHSIRVGAAQDLMTSGATLPIIMSRGRWSKPDTALRYIELSNT